MHALRKGRRAHAAAILLLATLSLWVTPAEGQSFGVLKEFLETGGTPHAALV
jgi:hypothetical protein